MWPYGLRINLAKEVEISVQKNYKTLIKKKKKKLKETQTNGKRAHVKVSKKKNMSSNR